MELWDECSFTFQMRLLLLWLLILQLTPWRRTLLSLHDSLLCHMSEGPFLLRVGGFARRQLGPVGT